MIPRLASHAETDLDMASPFDQSDICLTCDERIAVKDGECERCLSNAEPADAGEDDGPVSVIQHQREARKVK